MKNISDIIIIIISPSKQKNTCYIILIYKYMFGISITFNCISHMMNMCVYNTIITNPVWGRRV